MSHRNVLLVMAIAIIAAPVFAQEQGPKDKPDPAGVRNDAPEGDTWTRLLKERANRGTLHDAFQYVRGDTGKWNDAPILQHAPPIGQKPAKMSLDDWADQLREQDLQLTDTDDTWLLLRSRQLDDNDRVWVERIERRGKQITVVVSEAIWQGQYSKTFTYYSAFGMNLGKLEPGKYAVKCIIQPLAFKQFEGDGRPIDNWPKDERPAEQKPTELRATFHVVAKTSPGPAKSR